jgi:hypothetical protein
MNMYIHVCSPHSNSMKIKKKLKKIIKKYIKINKKKLTNKIKN